MRRFGSGLIAAVMAVLTIAGCARSPREVAGVTQDDSGRRVTAWIDPMYAQGPPHQYRSNHPGIAPDCNMKLMPVYADEPAAATATATSSGSGYSRVSIPQAHQQTLGVKVGVAEVRDLSRSIRTTGRVVMDERRVAQVRAKFEGFVESLYVNFTGQQVRRGDALLTIYSPDLLATQNELLLAERNSSELGRTLADAARARLRLWDMSSADIERVARTGKPLRAVTLRSPASGVVLTKNVVAGGRVMPSDTLYEIADLSRVWVLADVYESDLQTVHVGDTAQVTLAGQTLTGTITFIGPSLTAQTRTASVRIELDNKAALLKPDMFAEVVLQGRAAKAIAVPDSAVLNTGSRSVVLIVRPDGTFEPRDVTVGVKVEGFYEIRAGVNPGDRVVTDANFLIDSESRLKSALSQMNGSRP